MKVPTYEAPQVGANTLPTPNFRPVRVTDEQVRPLQPFRPVMGENTAGRDLKNLGDTIQRAGQFVGAIETAERKAQTEAQELADRVRVDDALNRAKESALRLTHDPKAGYLMVKGNNALERPDGASLEDEYAKTLTGDIGKISDGLGNDAQKALFSQKSAEILTNFRAGVMRHTAGEYISHGVSVAQGSQKLAIDQISRDYANPAAVRDGIESIKASVYQEAKLTGQSATWQEARVMELTSQAHKIAVAAALQNGDVSFAQGYLSKHSKEIDPADRLPLDRAIKTETDTRLGLARAEVHLVGARQSVDPSDMDRVFNITVQTESGGNPNAVSPKGAKGLMQVMDGTNKSPGYGVKPAQDDSPAERVRVGRDYLKAMIKEYGSLDRAWAAYNAGPGAVDKAIKKAEGAADKYRGVGATDYLAYLPKETQDYVAKNMAAYESGGGKGKAKTMEEVDASLRSDPYLAANPSAYKAAREQAERAFRDMSAAKKQREDDALSVALEEVEKNGGSYSGLPLSVRNAVPAEKRDTVMNFAEKVAKKAPIETDWSLYYELRSDPQKLANVNLGSFKDKLGNAEFKQLVDLQQNKDEQKTTVIRSAEEVLKTYMLQSGINPTDKSKDGAEKVGRVFSEFERRLNAFEVEQGKKATSKDAEQIAARMFTSVETYGSLWNKDKRAYELTPEDRIVVPLSDRRLIIDALTKHKKPVTEANILSLYRQQKGI